ncbi:GNAT family N-acetyltransferase [Acetivibrio straminisolvens]|jgi:GNAT superfamily N-acetyltransferase|uniref:GNAT family N-acetyltransferase n=1 Tax=Acetivibrio straminisolvens TaxID=253314 RepID=UPI00223FA02F|nr:GNAT family N-acetyltransferase [Acetivibrio straminisolvens]
MQISFNNRNDKEYQFMLNNLLKDIFLDFQFWYDLNLWDENYESYSIVENGEIVSNICVFKTQILFNKKQYPALSVGAVATKKEYRGRGLSRLLMEHIIKKYDNVPMYLSANDSVLDFYPKFGFKRVYEKLPVCECVINNDVMANKLSYDDPKVWDYVYKRVNFSQKLDCLNSSSINIFHIYWGYLKDYIYELPEIDTMVIAEQKGETLKLIGVFSMKDISFSDLIKYLPFANVKKIEFGFMPYWSDVNYIMKEYETDPLFVRGLRCDLGDFKFPELSIT